MARKSNSERLATVKAMLGISDSTQDTMLSTYLQFCKNEIVNQVNMLVGVPEDEVDIPEQYEGVLINAVIAGINLQGGENETSHSENGISRGFRYSDTTDYIKNNVIPIAKVTR